MMLTETDNPLYCDLALTSRLMKDQEPALQRVEVISIIEPCSNDLKLFFRHHIHGKLRIHIRV